MLSSLSSFSPALFKSNSNYLLRLFSTNAQPRIDPKLKENQSKAWDKTFDLMVKNVVNELEPNKYDQILSAPEPEFEQIFGGVTNDKFNSEVFMSAMMESIAKLTSKVKIPSKHINALSILLENRSEDEIEKAIKTVLPSMEN